MHAWLELIPHPDTRVEPLMLEDFIASLHGTGTSWAYMISYDGKHLSFYFIAPEKLANSVRKSLESRFNKIVVEDAKPIKLGKYKYYAELRLQKGFYYPLFHLTRQKEVESNPADVIASSMMEGESIVIIIAAPEPRGAGVIANFVYEKKSGKPVSTGKIVLKEALSMGDVFFGSGGSGSVGQQQYVYRPELTEEEKRILREAQYKMHHQLYATRIIVLAKEENIVYDVASSFNQFPLNGFAYRVKELSEKMLEEIKELKPRRLGLLFKDKRLPILSPRELAAYVNLPSALDTLPVKTASIIMGPPPEIPE